MVSILVKSERREDIVAAVVIDLIRIFDRFELQMKFYFYFCTKIYSEW